MWQAYLGTLWITDRKVEGGIFLVSDARKVVRAYFCFQNRLYSKIIEQVTSRCTLKKKKKPGYNKSESGLPN